MKDQKIDRTIDSFEMVFLPGEWQDFIDEINEMEKHDRWIKEVEANTVTVCPVDRPMDAQEVAENTGMDFMPVYDTAQDGSTKMYLRVDAIGKEVAKQNDMKPSYIACIRACAKDGLYDNAARLNGSALGRMKIPVLCQTLNNGIDVNSGMLLLLERYGRVAGIHSGAANGYCIMPISELIKVTQERLEDQFGRMEFLGGTHCHSYTTADWALPDAQGELLKAYQEALKKDAVAQNYAADFMPVVKFSSSDTKRSSARLVPVFRTSDGADIQLVEGVAVEHKKTGETQGVERYASQVSTIYALFNDAITEAKRLSKIEVVNPENCVVSLCRRYGICKKYGEAAREEIANIAAASMCVSALDVYIAMSNIVNVARTNKTPDSILLTLQENIAKILTADWPAHDVGGTVAWKD